VNRAFSSLSVTSGMILLGYVGSESGEPQSAGQIASIKGPLSFDNTLGSICFDCFW
jgi:hypothetical protein